MEAGRQADLAADVELERLRQVFCLIWGKRAGELKSAREDAFRERNEVVAPEVSLRTMPHRRPLLSPRLRLFPPDLSPQTTVRALPTFLRISLVDPTAVGASGGGERNGGENWLGSRRSSWSGKKGKNVDRPVLETDLHSLLLLVFRDEVVLGDVLEGRGRCEGQKRRQARREGRGGDTEGGRGGAHFGEG